MPQNRSFSGLLTVPVMLLALRAAEAQGFSSGPAICPPGASIAATGNPRVPYRCVRGGNSQFPSSRGNGGRSIPGASTGRWQGAQPRSGRGNSSVPAQQEPTKRGDCPSGSYQVPTNSPTQPFFCAPVRKNLSNSEAKCESFNADFNLFYQDEVRGYSNLAGRHHETERVMREQIEHQRSLSRSLRRQARNSRSSKIRSHLMRQSQSVNRDIKGRTQRLRETQRLHRSKESGRKQQFRQDAGLRLRDKPKNCKVAAAAPYKAD